MSRICPETNDTVLSQDCVECETKLCKNKAQPTDGEVNTGKQDGHLRAFFISVGKFFSFHIPNVNKLQCIERRKIYEKRRNRYGEFKCVIYRI